MSYSEVYVTVYVHFLIQFKATHQLEIAKKGHFQRLYDASHWLGKYREMPPVIGAYGHNGAVVANGMESSNNHDLYICFGSGIAQKPGYPSRKDNNCRSLVLPNLPIFRTVLVWSITLLSLVIFLKRITKNGCGPWVLTRNQTWNDSLSYNRPAKSVVRTRPKQLLAQKLSPHVSWSKYVLKKRNPEIEENLSTD